MGLMRSSLSRSPQIDFMRRYAICVATILTLTMAERVSSHGVTSGAGTSGTSTSGADSSGNKTRETLLFEHVTVTTGDPHLGQSINDASILIVDGMIVSVHANGKLAEKIPADVRRLDATGLHAIPAFIDAYTSLTLGSATASRNQDRDPDAKAGPTPRTRSALRAGMTPELNALDLVDTNPATSNSHRSAGFASAHVVPSTGYLSGAGAVISLSGQPLRNSVLREHTGIGASFKARHAGYPRSLMGVIAHLRQTMIDGDHHRRSKASYERQPVGRRRPPRDTTLDALDPVLDRKMPIFFAADTVNNIHRALRLSREFGFETVITGAREASQILDTLDQLGTPIILIPNDRDKPERDLEPGAPPARVQDRRTERWRERVGTASELAKRGMRFAFGTGKSHDPTKLLKAVRTAISEGLEPGIALRALTLGAAELLGMDATVGSIDSGKIASIAFLDSPFANDTARVRYLVADGVLFEYDSEDQDTEKGDEPPPDKDAGKDADKPDATKPIDAAEKKETSPEPAQTLPDHLLIPSELEEDRRPGISTNGNVLIRDGHVLTMAGTTHPRASIRVRQGKIAEIGVNLSASDDETVIDASGWYVMPGIIDCHSHMATQGGVNEFTDSITCQVRIQDVVDPKDVAIYRATSGGTTMAHILHGSANTIGGQCHLIRLKYGRDLEEMRVHFAPPTVKFALGENVKQSNFHKARGNRFPITRMGVEATIRRAFSEARNYEFEWKEHATRVARGILSLEPRRDLRLEALLAVIEGDMLVHSHCYRSDEIIMLLTIADEFGFRISTLQHVLEGYKVMPEIARHGAAASTFSDWWAYKIEAFDAIPHNASVMQRAAISVSLNSDSNELVRHLFYESAKACKYGGASEESALQMITLEPARQLGIQKRVGTIEVGKDADLAIFDAHPLSVYARCRYTLIEGEVYFEMKGDRVNPMAGRPMAPPEDFLPTPPEVQPEGLYAIKGARVVPIDRPPLANGTVVIADGKIAAVGSTQDTTIPAGAVVLEGTGLQVYPGFIDAGTDLGVTEIGAVRGTVDLGETGRIQPDLRMAVAIHPHSELIPVARAGGITNAAVFNYGGLISGSPTLIRLEADATPAAITRAELGMQINLLRLGKDKEKEIEKTLALWFDRAREAHARANQDGSPIPDPRLEALIPSALRKQPVFFAADREREIRLAINLAERLDVRAVVRGGRDAWKVATQLAEKDIPVIVGPVLSLPFERYDPYDSPYRNPGRLHAKGVPIAFQSTDGSSSRNLSHNAGTAVAYDLPHEAALRALTLGAAEILGVSDELGSITPGKTANLIITNGDPLEIRTQVRHVFIQGKPVSLESRHTKLYREFRDRLPPRRAKNF